jgi:hypothetical protein
MALRANSSISSISLDSDVQPKNHYYGISAFLRVSGYVYYEKLVRATSVFFRDRTWPYMGAVISSVRRCKVPEMYVRISREWLNRFQRNFLRLLPRRLSVDFLRFGSVPQKGAGLLGVEKFWDPQFFSVPWKAAILKFDEFVGDRRLYQIGLKAHTRAHTFRKKWGLRISLQHAVSRKRQNKFLFYFSQVDRY